MDKSINIFDGTTLPERKDVPQNTMQMRMQFVAAMKVPLPRDEIKILGKMKKIASEAADDFFYLWPVRDKKSDTGYQMISGGTVGLAENLFLEWGNSAIDDDIQDIGNAWKIKHIFIDFEKGIQRPKTTIIKKPKEIPTTWDVDRWERMMLNRAISFNVRDLIFSVIPRWLKDKIVEAAKIAAIKKAAQEYDQEVCANIFVYLKTEHGIDQEQILNFLGIQEINANNFFKVKNIFAQLKRGDIKSKDVLINTEKADVSRKRKTQPKTETNKQEGQELQQEVTKRNESDKAFLISQISHLCKNDNISIQKIEEMLSSKIEDVPDDILDGIINDWKDVKKNFDKKGNGNLL